MSDEFFSKYFVSYTDQFVEHKWTCSWDPCKHIKILLIHIEEIFRFNASFLHIDHLIIISGLQHPNQTEINWDISMKAFRSNWAINVFI